MTLRFEEYRGRVNDEAPLAALVARQYGVRHSIQELTLAEFRARAAAHIRARWTSRPSMASTAISSARPRTTSA